MGLGGPSRGLGEPLAWLCDAGRDAAGLAMPVFPVRNHSDGRLYSTMGHGLAYGLAYGTARARLALSVWLRLASVAILSIYRIMKLCGKALELRHSGIV